MPKIKLKNRPMPSVEVVEFYVKHYPDKMKLFKFKNPFGKRIEGFETKPKPGKHNTPSDAYQIDKNGVIFNVVTGEYTNPVEVAEAKKLDNITRSIRRTKTAISDLVLCNDWDYFATFTFNKLKIDRFDEQLVKKTFSVWLNNLQRNHGKFDYIVVPEFHKRCEECTDTGVKICEHSDRPKAIHFHCMIHGYTGKLTPATNPRTGKPLFRGGRQQFNSPSYTLGNHQFDPIGDKNKTSSYIRKYITKDLLADANGTKRYWHSKGLKTPEISLNSLQTLSIDKTPDLADAEIVYENDIFSITEIPLVKIK